MRTGPSSTCDAVTIVVFHVVTHSRHIVQMLASPALHSSLTHLHISCAGLDTVLLGNISYILLCSLRRSPFVNKSLSTGQLNAKYNRLIIQYTITYDTQYCMYRIFLDSRGHQMVRGVEKLCDTAGRMRYKRNAKKDALVRMFANRSWQEFREQNCRSAR